MEFQSDQRSYCLRPWSRTDPRTFPDFGLGMGGLTEAAGGDCSHSLERNPTSYSVANSDAAETKPHLDALPKVCQTRLFWRRVCIACRRYRMSVRCPQRVTTAMEARSRCLTFAALDRGAALAMEVTGKIVRGPLIPIRQPLRHRCFRANQRCSERAEGRTRLNQVRDPDLPCIYMLRMLFSGLNPYTADRMTSAAIAVSIPFHL